ncbi:Glyco transf 92 domain containing protein [Scophthalmus maximus]|uniref:Glycosyltransferase family 92 protein n=1 Tax=Scophthalmus maximus TaxID=52904 RepID=A0A2U9CIG3_SCOMX|nr:Glyco transf 92 domain containing protein [Scophthalmus maximus]
MDRLKELRWKLFLLLIATSIFMCMLAVTTPRTSTPFPNPHGPPKTCPFRVSGQTITPLNNTKHLLVSAFMDQRVKGSDIRVIGIFRRDSIQPLHCCFCCAGYLSATAPATILQHADHFGFPFVTTDVMCPIAQNCDATHVALLTQKEGGIVRNQTWLPIRNNHTEENGEEQLQFNFTVCISNLFGDYNNVLQFAQTLEMYRILGVDRVVIYNTSCGPDLDRLLRSYSQEGFVEMVPWPIDQHLNPSKGWLFSEHGGDVQYFGQLATLNECIYRSMGRSRYVLLNDIDEIVMPYRHSNMMSLMNMLQQQHPNTGVFLIENHIFPKKHFEPSGRFHLPRWNGVPGVNILEHIYREEPDREKYHPHKIIVQPRMVEQTSVHEVLKYSGQRYKVPPNVCRLIHTRVALQGRLSLEQLNVDKRLWDFHEKLIPNVDKALKRAGLLSTEGQS